MATLSAYRNARKWTQAQLAEILGVSQAYVSQLERGGRPISRKLAARLARLPDLPPAVVPPGHAELDAADADFAADLAALGYPGFRQTAGSLLGPSPHTPRATPKNPAAVIAAILSRKQVAPSVMAAIPWVLVTHTDLDAAWLVDQTRRRNLQNRLGFLADLALDLLRARAKDHKSDEDRASDADAAGSDDLPARISHLETLRTNLETSRLANPDTLARMLTSTERQFFEEHRSPAARHWNLLTGLTVAQLPYR